MNKEILSYMFFDDPTALSVVTSYPRPGAEILLYSTHAMNLHYYKYTVGGMNVVLISILMQETSHQFRVFRSHPTYQHITLYLRRIGYCMQWIDSHFFDLNAQRIENSTICLLVISLLCMLSTKLNIPRIVHIQWL